MRGMNRMSMRSNVNPFLKMSFETTTEFLRSATLGGEYEPLNVSLIWNTYVVIIALLLFSIVVMIRLVNNHNWNKNSTEKNDRNEIQKLKITITRARTRTTRSSCVC